MRFIITNIWNLNCQFLTVKIWYFNLVKAGNMVNIGNGIYWVIGNNWEYMGNGR